jgi:rod shape-determining protein MreD
MRLMWGVPTVSVVLALAIACAPFGAPEGARFVMPLLPYMAAHVFMVRGAGAVPSPVLFLAGLVMDLATRGPLGFWPLVYLSAGLVARLMPATLSETAGGRLAVLLAVVGVLAAGQVGLASIYNFEWVDWQGVVVGTVIAALPAALVEIVWRRGRDERRINVTERGAAPRGRV